MPERVAWAARVLLRGRVVDPVEFIEDVDIAAASVILGGHDKKLIVGLLMIDPLLGYSEVQTTQRYTYLNCEWVTTAGYSEPWLL